MLSKSSKCELGFVHHNAKFAISRFVISRFECTAVLQWGALPLTFKTYTSWFIVPPRSIIEASLVVKRKIYNKVYFYFGHNNAAMAMRSHYNLKYLHRFCLTRSLLCLWFRWRDWRQIPSHHSICTAPPPWVWLLRAGRSTAGAGTQITTSQSVPSFSHCFWNWLSAMKARWGSCQSLAPSSK